MNDWFRSWHGAPTDPKWLGIARRAGVAPGIAVAVAWALMDRASQSDDRGSIAGYDAEGLAYFYGCEPDQVAAIVLAMTDKGMITDGRFSSWEKRQPKREDGAAERAREWRERKRTQANAQEHVRTPDTDAEADSSSLRSEPIQKKREAEINLDEKAFQSWFSSWPTFTTDDEDKARSAWQALSPADRKTVTANTPGYITTVKPNPEHVYWVAHLPLKHSDENRVYAHADLDGNIPFEEQREAVLLWSRKPEFYSGTYWGKHFVHGHTPSHLNPITVGNRTNLDSGAVFGGKLSCAVFHDETAGGPLEFIQA